MMTVYTAADAREWLMENLEDRPEGNPEYGEAALREFFGQVREYVQGLPDDGPELASFAELLTTYNDSTRGPRPALLLGEDDEDNVDVLMEVLRDFELDRQAWLDDQAGPPPGFDPVGPPAPEPQLSEESPAAFLRDLATVARYRLIDGTV